MRLSGAVFHTDMVNAIQSINPTAGTSMKTNVDEATIDKYAYTRDFYLEQRRYKVSDGNVTREYENFDARRAPEFGEELDMAAAAAVERLELNRMGGDKLADSSIRTGN